MARYVFGIDLGGTTVKIGLLTEGGEKVEFWEIPTRTENNGQYILSDVAEAIRAKMKERGIEDTEVIGAGIGVPGAVNVDGLCYQAVNLGWEKINVVNELHSKLKLPVKAGNDANVAALGEAWKGGGQGYQNMLLVTLGTGVGGGIINEGKILAGSKGSGGEIGHINLEDDEPDACGCGNHGCFEQYASATGAVRLAKRILAATEEDSTLRHIDNFQCKDIFDAAKAGDKVAKDIADRYGYYLGKGIAATATVVNPEIIVLGGGVSKAGEMLFDLLKPSYEKYVFSGCKDVKFALAKLGNDAGVYGAAKMLLY
ncbi:ROK family glucokinase [Butyrivibrio sp. INlla14]|uniref:ROK family glucokinase n=1 Tax=Butyrivibrio sp. INlla14 TaxID=1520808 RepID=UPI0008764DBA|nr:ROK family glucokinase [Butyrivibrio sp. INlla14]SCY68336.1 glucokinase [Butyrivibrio sp. INlla14]